jgi:ATP-binding cassette subfamily C protein CydC
MSALLFFRPLFWPQRWRLLATLALALLALLAGTALLGVSGWFLTAAALAGAGAAFNIFTPSALVRGLAFLRIGARYGERLVGHDGTLRLLSDMRAWLFGNLFPKLPLAPQSPRHGDMVSRMTADIDALNTAFLVAIAPMVAALAVGTLMTTALTLLLPAAALAYAVLFVFSTLVVPAILVAATRRLGAAVPALTAELRIGVLDGVEGHADLVSFGARPEAIRRFEAAAHGLADVRQRLATLNAFAMAAVQALGALSLLALLWLGLGALRTGSLSGPVLVGLLLALLGSFEAPAAVARSLAKFSTAIGSAERLRSLALSPPRIADPRSPSALPTRFDVTFDGLRFAHDGGTPVLSDLTLVVPEGERLALKGASGAGKSTILQLALRLYDPQAGSVRIGGVDVRTLAQADLHRTVAYLEQSAPVFLDTVRANLAIADSTADDAALWRALEAARLADVVRRLPQGLDTVIGEAGRTLSAGQARRLCLARTLLSPARIVLLDEPTSGLDRETEREFLSDLGCSLAGRTVIMATHADLPEGSATQEIILDALFTRQAG